MDITFKNVNYIYQPNSPFAHQAINDLSFHIPSGSFVAVIGHTGSGKSTLIQHLNGLVLPTEDRKSTRLNSSHVANSYAVFCVKKKKEVTHRLINAAK